MTGHAGLTDMELLAPCLVIASPAKGSTMIGHARLTDIVRTPSSLSCHSVACKEINYDWSRPVN